MDTIIMYNETWAPIKEVLKTRFNFETCWIESPKFASNIIVETIVDKTIDRKKLIAEKFQETKNLSNTADVDTVFLAFQRMADLCQVLDYGPAGAWLGMFCEEVLEKYSDAQYWYNKAARFGYGPGMYRVGLLYLNKLVEVPEGVSVRRCFSDAYEKGVEEARRYLI